MRKNWGILAILTAVTTQCNVSLAGAIQDFPVYSGPADQLYPSVSGNYVAWVDFRNGKVDIYGKRLNDTSASLVTSSGLASDPAVSKDLVFWSDARDGVSKIYKYELNTRTEGTLDQSTFSQRFPKANEKYVVWMDARDGYEKIYASDIALGTEFAVSSLGGNKPPAVGGDLIVWAHELINPEIYAFNIQTTQQVLVCKNGYPLQTPVTNGKVVVWMDHRNNNADLYAKDLSTGEEFAICTNASTQQQPAMDGNIVVWIDGRLGHTDVWGYDLTTRQEFAISTYPSAKVGPVISGNLVVWQDDRNGNEDIYGAYIPEPATLAILCAGALVLLRRGR